MSPKDYVSRNSFNSGEISLLCDFRDDIAKYNSACLILENAVPLVEGGAKKMPGTYFAGATALGGSMFTASIAGTTLTVTAVNYGVLQPGQTIVAPGVTPGTTIVGSGNTAATGAVTGLGVSFTATCVANLAPTVNIAIAGDGSGASASVSWSRSAGPVSGSMYAWTPTLSLLGGTGYTTATATVTITNGNSTYPNGISVYPCAITYSPTGGGSGGTGTGGTGTYTISVSQTVSSEVMQTASNGMSRLVPFQFSTVQGAVLELSPGIIRIWEGASEGSWSLGLALAAPAENNYSPGVSYVLNNVALLGPFYWVTSYSGTPAGNLYIAAPYGNSNAYTVPITFTVNTADTLSVTSTGASPSQGINIALSNATHAHNAATAIQTAIRALASLNSGTSNFVDLTAWTVTPDTVYNASPWILAPTVWTQPTHGPAQRPVITYGWQNYSSVVQVVLANSIDQFPFIGTQSNQPNQVISLNATYWANISNNVFPPLQVTTPYLAQDIFALDCSTQSADVLWIFHPNYPPACVERQSANSWVYSLAPPGQQNSQPAYRGTLGVVKTGYSALGQSITAITQANPCYVTVSTQATFPFANGSRVYMNLIAGMVQLNQGEFIVANGSKPTSGTFQFSLQDPDTGANIDSTGFLAYVSGGFVVQVVPLFAAVGDYPACGTLYQQRLDVGGSLNNPTQFNGSVQGDYPDFICDPNQDDYAIQFTLVSNQVNQLLNMIGTPNALIIGTSAGIWIVTASTGQSISQTNVNAALQSSMGVSQLQPQLVNGSAIFVSRSSRIVTFLVFDFATNQWNNFDLTRLNRTITIGPNEATSGIAQTAFQMEPYPIYLGVRNDGQLIGLVFNMEDQVYAWFRINMLPGGGSIESAAVISGQNQEDQLVVVVNRTINGVTQRYVEYFMPQELFHQLSNAFFVHCGQQLQLQPAVAITGITNSNPPAVTAANHGFQNGQQVQVSLVNGMVSPNGQSINQDKTQAYTVGGATTNTFQLNGMDTTLWTPYVSGGSVMQVTNQVTGMSYLIGNEVEAVGDGALILEPTLVTSDVINFLYYCNLITIGLPYQVTIQPTNPVLSSQGATTRGMKQKLNRVTLSLYESMGGECGTDLDHMYPIDYGPGSMAQVPAMTTDEITVDLDGDWTDESTFYIRQNQPFPFTLRGLVWRDSANQD